MMRAPAEAATRSKTMKTTLPNRIQRLLNGGKDSSWPGAIADSVPFYSCSATEVRKVHTQITARPREQVIAAIQALDLDPIKFKLMDAEEGQGWSREYVDQMAIEYKRFLTLSVKYPDETIAPSKDVDKFWHGHILDTMKYAEDCQNVFGYFLHHFPYFGMRGEEDAANLAEAGRTANRLYEKEFGDAVASRAAYCSVAKPAYCSVAVTGEKAAYCSVAIAKSAYCSVAVTAEKAAYCSVAKPAYCSVAVTGKKAAYCSVAIAKPAYCSVAATEKKAAYCSVSANDQCGRGDQRDKLNTSLRPTLALAA